MADPREWGAIDELRRDRELLQPYLPAGTRVRVAPASAANYSESAQHPWGCTLDERETPAGPRVQAEMSVLHTPETRRGSDALTPRLFAQAGFGASTHAFVQSTGELWLMVPMRRYPWGEGTSEATTRLPRPRWWRDEMRSYNCVGMSVEVQGHARDSGAWMRAGTPQWVTTVALVAAWSALFGYPPTRARVLGHGELSTMRSDPGPEWPWAAFLAAVRRASVLGRLSSEAASGIRE